MALLVPDCRLAFHRNHTQFLKCRLASRNLGLVGIDQCYYHSVSSLGEAAICRRSLRMTFHPDNFLLTCQGFKVDAVDGAGCLYDKAADNYLDSGIIHSSHSKNLYGSRIALSRALMKAPLVGHPQKIVEGGAGVLHIAWYVYSRQEVKTSEDHQLGERLMAAAKRYVWHESVYYDEHFNSFHSFRSANGNLK